MSPNSSSTWLTGTKARDAALRTILPRLSSRVAGKRSAQLYDMPVSGAAATGIVAPSVRAMGRALGLLPGRLRRGGPAFAFALLCAGGGLAGCGGGKAQDA